MKPLDTRRDPLGLIWTCSHCSLNNNSLCIVDESIVVIDTVDSDSPAAMAGLLPGDHLILINGQLIDSRAAAAVHKTSTAFACKVIRGGLEVELSTTKNSADDALGVTVKSGINTSAIQALCNALPKSDVRSIRCLPPF